jgi:hypothetical protein
MVNLLLSRVIVTGISVAACVLAACHDGKPNADAAPEVSDGLLGDLPLSTAVTCGVATSLERPLADVLLILDSSTSMLNAVAGTGGNSRWEEITTALNQILPATNDQVNWGLMQFPGQGGGCSAGAVDVPVAPSNAAAVMAYYAAHRPPVNNSSTPTRASLAAAADWLSKSPRSNPKFIVLATDGEPNCGLSSSGQVGAGRLDVDATVEIVAAAAPAIPVFVVGIATAGTSAVEALDRMAVAGGRPKSATSPQFYTAETGKDFATTMNEISGQVASCLFSLKAPPSDPDAFLLLGDGSRAARDVSRKNGWDFTSPASTTIELFGRACEEARAQRGADVKLVVGCRE